MNSHTILILAAMAGLLAGQPPIINAKLENRSAASGLETQFRTLVSGQDQPAWIGYTVPMVAGEHRMCCYYSDGNTQYSGCLLEPRDYTSVPAQSGNTVRLESPKDFFVLFRVEQKQVSRIRTFSSDCQVDAGGTTVYWFDGVKPAESAALLDSFVKNTRDTANERSRIRDSAASAIALHADAAADAYLESYIGKEQPESLRRHVVSWLGYRGRKGYDVLSRILREETDDRLREQAVSGLGRSKEPAAQETLLTLARGDKSARVRGQAVSVLAERVGVKAIPVIQNAMENDPDRDVRRRAVQALSRLPEEEGIPLIIQVARSSKNPELRKEAMHALGRSHNPRVQAFFEEILGK
jgi:hypothetical protein